MRRGVVAVVCLCGACLLPLPLAARVVLAACVLAATALLVLWRPAGRPLEEWAFVLLRYWAMPRAAVWQPRERPLPPRAAREVVLRPLAGPPVHAVTRRGDGHAAAP